MKIVFKIWTEYYLELLMHETMKILESTEKKKNKDKNCENFSDLEITDVVLVHCNIINNNLQINSGFEYTCFL